MDINRLLRKGMLFSEAKRLLEVVGSLPLYVFPRKAAAVVTCLERRGIVVELDLHRDEADALVVDEWHIRRPRDVGMVDEDSMAASSRPAPRDSGHTEGDFPL
jgi:hypothetical protein